MKVILFTSTSLRHIGLSKRLSQSKKFIVERVFHESMKKNSIDENRKISGNQINHLKERSQSEKDIFSWFLDDCDNENYNSEYVEYGWFSSNDCLERIKKIGPDLILVYGSSIIKGEIINLFRNRIITYKQYAKTHATCDIFVKLLIFLFFFI